MESTAHLERGDGGFVSQLNVFIDGSWLYKACGSGTALAAATVWPEQAFRLDFSRLDQALLGYARSARPSCDTFGERFISTSIFSLPDDFDDWPRENDSFTEDDIVRTRRGVDSRQHFVDGALAAGYSGDAVYHPRMKVWMLERLKTDRYQEKQVDATVVALLVRSAITCPDDVHVVITGDADVLPAIRVAYPEYSKNVVVATTHPDELLAERRQTSFSLGSFQFETPPYFLQDHVADFIAGAHIYTCAHCHKVFYKSAPIPANARPCCVPCHQSRT